MIDYISLFVHCSFVLFTFSSNIRSLASLAAAGFLQAKMTCALCIARAFAASKPVRKKTVFSMEDHEYNRLLYDTDPGIGSRNHDDSTSQVHPLQHLKRCRPFRYLRQI